MSFSRWRLRPARPLFRAEGAVRSILLQGRLRERLDMSLFLRRLLGAAGFRVARFLPRGRFALPKEYCVHGVVLLIVGAVVAANLFLSASDRHSLLFALFGEPEIEEGVVPARHARDAAARGALLGVIPAAVAGGVSEEDLEFELANTLGGNALLSTAVPETAEASGVRRRGVVAYTVTDGDTPSSVAAKFGVSTNTVLWANGIRGGDLIHQGDILVIPPVSGVLHAVVNGDDVTSLAQKYDANVENIIVQNGLGSDGAIRVGQKLVIPDGQIRVVPRRLAVQPEEEPEAPEAPEAPAPSTPHVPGLGLLWPVPGRSISQYFGWRHTGVDLPNRSRPTVRAAQDGEVAFAGWLGGYGRLVILDHGRGMRTYYAHMSETHVKSGARVGRGETIGRVGQTGRATGPHLHFEVRSGGRPANPLRYF